MNITSSRHPVRFFPLRVAHYHARLRPLTYLTQQRYSVDPFVNLLAPNLSPAYLRSVELPDSVRANSSHHSP